MHEKIIAPIKKGKQAICPDYNTKNIIRVVTEHKITLIKELAKQEPSAKERLEDISTGIPESLIQSIVCDVGMISEVLGIEIMGGGDAAHTTKAT